MNPHDVATLKALCHSLRRRSSRLVALTSLPSVAAAEAEAAVNAAHKMEEIVQARFDAKATDGVSWAPRKRAYAWPLLQRTGRLLSAALAAVRFTYRIGGTRWNVGAVATPYARFINNGTETMEARKFMADPSKEELRPANKLAARVARAALRRMMR